MAQQIGSVTQAADALAPIKTQRLAAFVQAAIGGAATNIDGIAAQMIGSFTQSTYGYPVKLYYTRQGRGSYGQTRTRIRHRRGRR